MAQNVESTINIKVNADTSNAQRNTEALVNEINKLASEASKGNNTFVDFSESIDRLSQGFSQLGNTSEQVSNNMENIGNRSSESSINVEQLNNLLGSLAKGGQLNASTFEKLGSALGMSGGELVAFGAAAAAIVATLKILSDQAKEMANTFNKVAEGIGDAALGGVVWFVDSLNELSAVLDESINKLQEFADMGIEIQNSYVGLGNFIGTDALTGLDNYSNALESLVGIDATGIIGDMSKLGGALAELGASSEQAEAASKSLYELALNLHGFSPSTSTTKAIEGITKALQTGKIDYRTNKALYDLLGNEGVKQFNSLSNAVERYNFLMENSASIHDAYQKYLETDAGKIEVLRQQYSSLMGNIGQIALHLYAMVAPVLTAILQLANGVLGALMKIFNINVKTSTGVSGASGLGGLKKDLDEVGGSAAKASKQLASFDDVIQINDNKSSGAGALGDIDTAGLGDFSSILDDLIDDSNELTDIWAHFKELMESGDYFGAGKEFMQVITDQLRKIDWDDIKSKASQAGKSLAEFLNGIFDVSSLDGLLNWRTIGETIAEALNTIIAAVGSFLKEFDFNMMGKALGQAWDSLWDNLDTEGAAEALYEAFMGVFEFVNGWLEGGGLSRMAQGLADIISNFFSNFDIETDTDTIVNAVVGVIDDIINALYIVAEALTSDDVRKVVFTLIEKLVGAFKDNAADWGTKLNTIASDIMSFLSDAMTTADNAGLQSAIGTFLENLKLGDLLHQYIELKVQAWLTAFGTKTKYMIDSVGGLILKVLEELLYRIAYIIGNLIGNILKLLYNLGAKIGEVVWGIGEAVFGWLGTFIGKVLGDIIGLFANIIIYAIAFGTGIITKIKEIILLLGEMLSEFVTFIIGGIAKLGTDIATGIAGIAETVGNKVGEFIDLIKAMFNDFWEFVKGIFDVGNWIDLGKKAIDGLWQGIKDIWNSTIGSWSFDIPGFEIAGKKWDGIHFDMPKLATGGIVTGPTTALIGEAGAEAVLPLKNNTQWMDILASKVANQITSGNAINGGTIRLELTDKPFYTRAEMYEFGALVAQSLNAYGINIAVV